MSVQTPEELQANLDEYRGQLEQVLALTVLFGLLSAQTWLTVWPAMQVDELLTLDPGNAEYQDLHTSLLEVQLGAFGALKVLQTGMDAVLT